MKRNASPAPGTSRQDGEPPAQQTKRRPQILVADDDVYILRAFAARFKAIGLYVRTSADAMHALTMIHRDPPDLVVLDIKMPAGNGLSVCEMLATDDRLKQIPVILMTGQIDEAIALRCQRLGAQLVQKSPSMWMDMIPLIRRLLPVSAADLERWRRH